jgi:hypothetical protein
MSAAIPATLYSPRAATERSFHFSHVAMRLA